ETRGCFKYVVTLNVHHRVRLLEDPATMQPALRAGAAFVLRLPRAEPPGLVQRSVSARHYRQLSPTVIEAALGPRLSPRRRTAMSARMTHSAPLQSADPPAPGAA